MFLLLVDLRNPLVFLQSVVYLLLCASNRLADPRFIDKQSALVQKAIVYGLNLGFPRGLSYPYNAAHIIARITLYEASRAFAINGGLTGAAQAIGLKRKWGECSSVL